jgi:hypothetical protein
MESVNNSPQNHENQNENGSARSATTGFTFINRNELIEKMEQLKAKFQLGIQFA